VTIANLNSSGKMESEMERLMRVVIGKRRALRHDLRRRVGIRSIEQVASEEESIAERTSSIVAGENVDREGGGKGGGRWGDVREAGRESRVERSLTILSPKKLRKEVARREGEGE
jgi:hypothetical protein